MPNPKRSSAFPRGAGGKFSPVPTEHVTFIEDLLKASRGKASYGQVARAFSRTGVPISAGTVKKIAVKAGLEHKNSNGRRKMHFVNIEKMAVIAKYIREKAIAARARGEKSVAVSVNELIGFRGKGTRVVSGTKKSVGVLLDAVIKHFSARESELGLKVVRATVADQAAPRERVAGNYRVICDFVFSAAKSGIPVSPKLLRKVFRFSRSTAEKYLYDLNLDPRFVKRLSAANLTIVRARAGMNTKVDVEKLKRIWAHKIVGRKIKPAQV